jgi:hypothetical protein
MSGPAYIDAFRRIRVLPDDVVVAADAVDDQLTLVAGAGISLVANANSDQITIVNTNTSSPSTELFAKSITVDNISIDTNVIQINESNADLIIRANASGSVIAEAGASIYEFDPTGILKVSDEQLFINTNSNNTSRSWYFENTTLGLPSVGDGTLVSEFRLPVSDNNSTSSIIFPGAGAPTEWGGIAYITEPGGILEDLYANALNVYMVGADVRITAQDELNTITAKQWTFKTNGQLQFPDGTIQNTAWTNSIGNDITVGSIRINTNVIRTVDSNANLELAANGSGIIKALDYFEMSDGTSPQGEWTGFIPAWTGSTTNPVIGNGLSEGRYKQVGNTVHVWMMVTMGSTTTFGTGEYKISLPVTARAISHVVLNLVMNNEGTRLYNSLAHNGATTSLSLDSDNVTLFWDTGVVTNTAPFTWADGDWFIVSGSYEAS